MAGAADQPGIDQSDARAGRAVALGAERGQQPAGAAADDEDVGLGEQAVKLFHAMYPIHHGRGRFFTDGCTSTMLSGQKISQLKQVMQCSRNLMTGRRLVSRKPAIGDGRRGARLHVDDIGRADDVADAAAGAFLDFDMFDHATLGPSASLAAPAFFFCRAMRQSDTKVSSTKPTAIGW